MNRYKLSEKQVSTSLSGETVILQYDSGEYYSLNEMGSYIWNLLEQRPQTLAELTDSVCANFETQRSSCESDISSLIQDLENEELVSKTT